MTVTATAFAGSGASLTSLNDSNISGEVAVGKGGTGSSTQSGARTNLGLGSMATQAHGSVDMNGGNIDGTTIATSDITVGSGKTLQVTHPGVLLIPTATSDPDSPSPRSGQIYLNTGYGGKLRIYNAGGGGAWSNV